MRRVWTLVGAAAIALTAHAAVARAATTDEPAVGKVVSLSIVPASGHAEVVIAVTGAVEVQDFTLATPPRLVLDVHGARLAVPSRMYDKVPRGVITNLRVAQFRDDVVRVVVDLDSSATYTVTRQDGEIHVTLDGPAGHFAAWHVGGELDAAEPTYAATGTAAAAPARARTVAPPVRRSEQPRITVTYVDSDIRDVIAAFAAYSHRTIVVGADVKGTVSAEVHDQPWDVALRAILKSQGLDAKEDANGIITVDSYKNIAAQRATEPLATRIIPVNYQSATSLVPTIEGLLSRQCAPGAGTSGGSNGQGACVVRGDVAADSANRLIVTDVASRLDEIVDYVKKLDLRLPQVAIKAKIILVNRTNIEDLGVSYDLGSNTQFFNRMVQRRDPSTFTPTDFNGDGVIDGMGGGDFFDANTPIIDLGGNALSAIANANQRVVQPALQLIFSTALGKFDLTAFLDALQEVRLADVQAEPSITTLSDREATLWSGEETPIRVVDAGSNGGAGAGQAPRSTVQFKKTGIILTVTPHVTPNGHIRMAVHAERSSLQPAASDLGYTFNEQQADNEILVADGETAVIGGLTVTSVEQSKVGIPILVDLPLIGKLFGETKTNEVKDDLLILITPHIIDAGEKLGAPGGDR